jgi:hypothetical protein
MDMVKYKTGLSEIGANKKICILLKQNMRVKVNTQSAIKVFCITNQINSAIRSYPYQIV